MCIFLQIQDYFLRLATVEVKEYEHLMDSGNHFWSVFQKYNLHGCQKPRTSCQASCLEPSILITTHIWNLVGKSREKKVLGFNEHFSFMEAEYFPTLIMNNFLYS